MTTSATARSRRRAPAGGNVTSDGGASVTERGVCWSLTANPTISDSHTHDGSGTGGYTSSLTGLTPGEIYHVRAYATNSSGTGYGNDISFTTTEQIDLPTVTTSAAGSITSTSALAGGNVTSDGGVDGDCARRVLGVDDEPDDLRLIYPGWVGDGELHKQPDGADPRHDLSFPSVRDKRVRDRLRK